MLMGTAERSGAPADEDATEVTAPAVPEAPDRDIPVTGPEPRATERQPVYRPLWREEPARRRRLPDPVRTAAVRAVLVVAVTLILAMVAFLCTLAESWLAFPMVLGSVAGTVVATWGVLDVWVTRQVWNQRHGVVSEPSSTARSVRRERRRARRQARAAEGGQGRIGRRGGAGQLSHS
jgi:transposase